MKNTSKIPNIYLGIILFILYVPIFIVIAYSFNSSRINTIWESFSLHWYRELFLDQGLMESLKNSLVLAGISSIGAAIIGTLGAVGMSRLNFFGKGAIEFFSSFPIMTPEIILAMVFLAFFTLLGISFGMGTLIIAHTSFSIPYVYMQVKARLVGMDESFVEAARDLGASSPRAFWDITLPAVSPAIVSGMMLAFAMSMDDVVISIFVNGAKSNTLPVKIYTQLKTGVSPKINALCALMFLVTTVIVVISGLFSSRNSHRTNFSKEETVI